MGNRAQAVGWLVLLGLLVVLLYPALFLGQQVAPEASLRNAAPWRLQWGPHPDPSPLALEAATGLGPRLAGIAREGTDLALWNPYVGGGRAGWLASAHEGGTPLALLAAFLAAPGWTFTALVAIEIAAAFGAVFLFLRRLDLMPWAAAAAAMGYALSGAVAGHLIDASGSALALGPLALLPASIPAGRTRTRILAWSATLVLLLASGAAALPFMALGIALDLVRHPARPARSLGAVAAAALIALAVVSPRLALSAIAAEPGATTSAPAPSVPLASPAALVEPFPTAPADEPFRPGADLSDPNVRGDGFLGLPLLLLATVGIGVTLDRRRAFWLAAAGIGVALAFVPSSLLARGLALTTRPLGLLALSVAVLAGLGLDRLLGSLASLRARAFLGIIVCGVLIIRMLPPLTAHIPFAPVGENVLESPLPNERGDLTGRVAALVDTLPPDVAEVLGLADVRATDLRGEPRYAALLDADPDGLLSAGRALAPSLERLGVEWVLEPLPVRVVSGQIFAQAILDTGTLMAGDTGGSTLGLDMPPGATRLGLPRSWFTGRRLELVFPGRHALLPENAALADESTAWAWVTVPPDWPSGSVRLRVTPPMSPPRPTVTVAWDTSGLLLDDEAMGVRVWRRQRFWPRAFLAEPGLDDAALRPAPERGHAVHTLLSTNRIEADVDVGTPSLLVALVKYRPGLWHATVDGARARVQRAAGVWSAVPVSAGRHRVRFEARLPAGVWGVALAGLAAMVGLAAWKEQR